MARWTPETKSQAIEMLKADKDIQTVAKMFNMSSSSVVLLKYSDAVYGSNEEKVICQLCGARLKQITYKHLRKHKITIEDYKIRFPAAKTMNEKRHQSYVSFQNPNKGKTYDEIYGTKQGKIKRDKISKKQIGRPAPKLAGTGITGTRRDTNTFARSTYEANVDRIFILEKKKYIDELSKDNERFTLLDGIAAISYQPDRVDLDGLFCKGAYLEIKGYMYPEDWKKISLFREQYPNKKLLVICPDTDYCDINYKDLQKVYCQLIPLWECSRQNYKTRPDLYKIGYKTPEHIIYLEKNYPQQISINIDRNDVHKIFVANKCIEFNKFRMGKKIYVENMELLNITNRRKGASRKSSGEYNYELWRIEIVGGEKFYVTNQSKTVDFYCYSGQDFSKITNFFIDNCNMSLSYGMKD